MVYGLLKVKGVGQVPGPFHCLAIDLNILRFICQDAVVHRPDEPSWLNPAGLSWLDLSQHDRSRFSWFVEIVPQSTLAF